MLQDVPEYSELLQDPGIPIDQWGGPFLGKPQELDFGWCVMENRMKTRSFFRGPLFQEFRNPPPCVSPCLAIYMWDEMWDMWINSHGFDSWDNQVVKWIVYLVRGR